MIFMAGLMLLSTASCGTRTEDITRVSRETKEKQKDDVAEEDEIDSSIDEEDAIDENDSIDAEVRESVYNKCAMMIYIVGSNLESENGLATKDIEEMIDSGYDEKLMDIYICTGGASKWHTSEISEDEIAIYKLEDEDLIKLDTVNNSTMANPNTLKTFVNKAYEDTDSDCYNLILWNHGAGAVVGFGADETDDYQAMTIPEIATAIDESDLIKSGKKFEVIGFDACLMGMIEVATSLDDYSSYLVASEELIPGQGWDYTCLGEITETGDFSGDTVGQIIVDSYEECYKKKAKYSVEYSLACIDLSKARNVEACFGLLVADGIDDLSNGNYSDIARARAKTKAFGRVSGMAFYDTVDLYNLAENMSDIHPDSTMAIKKSIEEMVIYYKSNIQRSHGLAVYFPYDNGLYVDEWLEDYKELEFCDNYKIFLDGYVMVMQGESLADWDVGEQIAQQNPNIKGQYSVQLTDEQAKNAARYAVQIWAKGEGMHDFYIRVRSSSDVVLNADNQLVANFEDRICYLCNGAGESTPLSLIEIDRNDEYVMYEAMISYDDGKKYGSAWVRVRVDDQHPDGELVGIFKDNDISETNLFPQEELMEFEDNTFIYGILANKQAKFDDDGVALPFSEWDGPYMLSPDSFYTDGEFSCKFESDPEIEENGYFCLFYIRDTQGEIYEVCSMVAEDRVDDADTYLVDSVDTTLTESQPFNASEGKAALFDRYGEQIIVLKTPDGKAIVEDHTYSWQIQYCNKSKNGKEGPPYFYFKDLSYGNYADYLMYGEEPDPSSDPYFKFDIRGKYDVEGVEIWIADCNSGWKADGDEVSAFIQYMNCYGDTCYIQVQSDYFKNLSDDQILEIIYEYLN